ncbi:hypothetical protein GY45DRAFT_1337654 [Cubamyces sp. BRFM 1775]|nr:hypothetical protein GY45DRAFT_1337654 [Cubamyces sp. BRFM 1775]
MNAVQTHAARFICIFTHAFDPERRTQNAEARSASCRCRAGVLRSMIERESAARASRDFVVRLAYAGSNAASSGFSLLASGDSESALSDDARVTVWTLDLPAPPALSTFLLRLSSSSAPTWSLCSPSDSSNSQGRLPVRPSGFLTASSGNSEANPRHCLTRCAAHARTARRISDSALVRAAAAAAAKRGSGGGQSKLYLF